MVVKNRHFKGWNDQCDGNFVYRIGNTKVYERGNDKPKPGWKFEELRKVRIEFTARYYHLKVHGIKLLSDFIEDPMFTDAIASKIQFKKFERSSKLPWEFDEYLAEDNLGNRDSFQEEYRKHRKLNPSQYMVDDPDFAPLKARIIEATKRTQKNWLRGKESKRNTRTS